METSDRWWWQSSDKPPHLQAEKWHEHDQSFGFSYSGSIMNDNDTPVFQATVTVQPSSQINEILPDAWFSEIDSKWKYLPDTVLASEDPLRKRLQLRADVNLITSSSKRSSEIGGKKTYPDGYTNQGRVLRMSSVVIRAREPWGETMGVRRNLFPS